MRRWVCPMGLIAIGCPNTFTLPNALLRVGLTSTTARRYQDVPPNRTLGAFFR